MRKLFKDCLLVVYSSIFYKFLFYLGYLLCKRSEKKAIFGSCDIAGVLSALRSIYKEKCISFSRASNRFYSTSDFDIVLKESFFSFYFKSPFIFGKLVKNAKSFLYVGGYSYTPNKEEELKILYTKGIPILVLFLGSEIRSPVLFREDALHDKRNVYYDFIGQDELLLEKDAWENARLADKYATLVFSYPKDQISYIKKEQLFFPPVFDFSKINDRMTKFEDVSKIKILHAPSNPNIKGTPIIRAVIRALETKGYDFEYKELIGVDNSVVLEELQSSHIVLNQFYLLIPGIFGLEALANCNAVLMSAHPSEFPYEFSDAWLVTYDYQIFDHLRYLLDNPKEIKKYALNGYKYILNNFSQEKIQSQIEKYLYNYI